MEDFLKDPFEETPRSNDQNYPPRQGTQEQFQNPLDFQLNQESEYLTGNLNPDVGFSDLQNENFGQGTITDPYLEAFDFLGSPSQHGASPNVNAVGDGYSDFPNNDTAFGDGFTLNAGGQDQMNKLDSLVSPERTHETGGMNMFATSQYFSPSSKTANFGHLNSIVEDSLSPTYYGRTLSPNESRHGSVSIPAPSTANSYVSSQALMSPQSNAYEGSYDNLKSPYSGSYLGSPPAMSLAQNSAIGSASNYMNNSQNIQGSVPMSPAHQNFAYSVSPGYHNSSVQRKVAEANTNGKQLTSEEKAKRRREFHNAVERRRRDLIKEKIKVLGILVPPSLLTPQVCAVKALSKQGDQNSKEMRELATSVKIKEAKPNKAFILQTSVDYIRHLQYVEEQQRKRSEELQASIRDLESKKNAPQDLFNSGSSKLSGAAPSATDFNPDEFFSDEINFSNLH